MLRFFANMTQSQIATDLGISQMHVSRLLARTLAAAARGPARRGVALDGSDPAERRPARGGATDTHDVATPTTISGTISTGRVCSCPSPTTIAKNEPGTSGSAPIAATSHSPRAAASTPAA